MATLRGSSLLVTLPSLTSGTYAWMQTRPDAAADRLGRDPPAHAAGRADESVVRCGPQDR